MNAKIIVAAVAAVAVAGLIGSDLSHQRGAAAIVDRLYLSLSDRIDAASKGMLEDAEKEISRHSGRMVVLPKSAVRNAAREIHRQLFMLNMKKEHIDRLLSEMTEDDASTVNRVNKTVIDRETASYARDIPEFKSKLSYIRRAL